MVQLLHLVPITIFSTAGLLSALPPLSPKNTHISTHVALCLVIPWLTGHPCQGQPPQPVTTAHNLGLPALLSRVSVFILSSRAQDMCPAAAAHTSAIHRYAQTDRNRCNSLMSRQNRIRSNNYTQNISCSLLGLTDRNTADAGRWTLVSPRQAKEDCTQSYSTPE